MSRTKTKTPAEMIDQMQGEASWLLSHAQALADYGRNEYLTGIDVAGMMDRIAERTREQQS